MGASIAAQIARPSPVGRSPGAARARPATPSVGVPPFLSVAQRRDGISADVANQIAALEQQMQTNDRGEAEALAERIGQHEVRNAMRAKDARRAEPKDVAQAARAGAGPASHASHAPHARGPGSPLMSSIGPMALEPGMEPPLRESRFDPRADDGGGDAPADEGAGGAAAGSAGGGAGGAGGGEGSAAGAGGQGAAGPGDARGGAAGAGRSADANAGAPSGRRRGRKGGGGALAADPARRDAVSPPQTEAGALADSDVVLIDIELAEHQRWAAALGNVGEVGSIQRAAFIAESVGGGFINGVASGTAMSLGLGLASRAVPLLGPAAGGYMAWKGLRARDWAATGADIGKFGEGNSPYQVLANSLKAVSQVVDVVTGILDFINSIAGVVKPIALGIAAGAGVLAFFTFGATAGVAIWAGHVANVCIRINTIIGDIVLPALNVLSAGILNPCMGLFNALHRFTSKADPREVETGGHELSEAAGAAAGALGGWLGGKAAHAGSKSRPPDDGKPLTPKPLHETPGPATGAGPEVHFKPPGPTDADGHAAPARPAEPAVPVTPTRAAAEPKQLTLPHVDMTPTAPPSGVPPKPALHHPITPDIEIRGNFKDKAISVSPDRGKGPPKVGDIAPYSEQAKGGKGEVIREHVIPGAQMREGSRDPEHGGAPDWLRHSPGRSAAAKARAKAKAEAKAEAKRVKTEARAETKRVKQEAKAEAERAKAEAKAKTKAEAAAKKPAKPKTKRQIEAEAKALDKAKAKAEAKAKAQADAEAKAQAKAKERADAKAAKAAAKAAKAAEKAAAKAARKKKSAGRDYRKAESIVEHEAVSKRKDVLDNAATEALKQRGGPIDYVKDLLLPSLKRHQQAVDDAIAAGEIQPHEATDPTHRALTALAEMWGAGEASGGAKARADAEKAGVELPKAPPSAAEKRTAEQGRRQARLADEHIEDINWDATFPGWEQAVPHEQLMLPHVDMTPPARPEPTTHVPAVGSEPSVVVDHAALGVPPEAVLTSGPTGERPSPPKTDVDWSRLGSTHEERIEKLKKLNFDPNAPSFHPGDPHPQPPGGFQGALGIPGYRARTTGPGGEPIDLPTEFKPEAFFELTPDRPSYATRAGDRGKIGGAWMDHVFDDLAQAKAFAQAQSQRGPDALRSDSALPEGWAPDRSGKVYPGNRVEDYGVFEIAPNTPTIRSVVAPQPEGMPAEGRPNYYAGGGPQTQLPSGLVKRDTDPLATYPIIRPGETPGKPTMPTAPDEPAAAGDVARDPDRVASTPADSAALEPSTTSSAGSATNWSTRARLAGEMFLPALFGPDGEAPSYAQQRAAYRARFTGDNQPAEGVERANPHYTSPPGTQAQIDAIKAEILNLLAVRARAEREAEYEGGRAQACEDNRAPVKGVMADARDQLSAVAAHEAAIARREAANQDQQQRQQEAAGLVAGYPSRKAGLLALTLPLKAWRGFTSLASNLPGSAGDKMLEMNQEAEHMQDQLDQMDTKLGSVDKEQPAREGKLANDDARLSATGEKAQSTDQKLQTANQCAADLHGANEATLAEARRRREAATARGESLQDEADKREHKADSLAAQLQDWAVLHRDERARAIAATARRLEEDGNVVTRPPPD